jgi:hypothetical protein
MKMQKRRPRNLGFAGLAIQIGVIALVCPFMAATGAWADEMYTYTGPDFNAFTGSDYNTSNFVSGSIILSTPLGDNLSNANESADIASFSFSDGNQTITNKSSGVSEAYFNFWTNASGTITGWELQFVVGSNDYIETSCMHSAPGCANGYIDKGELSSTEYGYVYTGTDNGNGKVGSWIASPVPEPGTLSIMSLGLLGLGLLVGVKRRRGMRQGTEA